MIFLIFCVWYYYCIDTTGAVGSNVVVDANHNPHIFYYSINNQLVHTWWSNLNWQREIIAPVASYHNAGPAVIIDNQGRFHIAYYNNSERLGYAFYNGTWTIEQVDTTYRTGDYCDIEIDGNGNPSIAYHRYTGMFSGYLRFARKISGQWQIIEQATEYGGYHANLEFDNQGNAHISDCTSWSGGDLRYLTYDGENWQIEKPTLTNVGGYNSMVLDNQGRPQISFYWADGTNYDLKFTNKNSGAWQVYTVDHGLQLFKRGWDNHIAIDNNQNLHIAYHCHNEDLLKYARGIGNSWNTQIVDSIGGYDSYIGIALDGNDVFISYHNEYTTELWLASTRNLLGIEERRKSVFLSETLTKGYITIPPKGILYDVCGRLKAKNYTPHSLEYRIPNSGIYFLKMANNLHKIVVIK
jgi:hypothetical protein